MDDSCACAYNCERAGRPQCPLPARTVVLFYLLLPDAQSSELPIGRGSAVTVLKPRPARPLDLTRPRTSEYGQ